MAGASVGSVHPQGQERKHGTQGTGLLAPTSLSLFALGASAAAQVGSSAPQNRKQDSTPLPFSTAPPASPEGSHSPALTFALTSERQEAAMFAPWGLGSPSLRQRLPSTWGGAVALTGPQAQPTQYTGCPLLGRDWKIHPLRTPTSITPSGTRFGPQVPQHPSAGAPPTPRPQTPEPSPTCYCRCQGTSTLGWATPFAVSTPLPVFPRGPLMLHGTLQGSVSDVFRPHLATILRPGSRRSQGCRVTHRHCVCRPRLSDISSDTCETPRRAVVSAMHLFCI